MRDVVEDALTLVDYAAGGDERVWDEIVPAYDRDREWTRLVFVLAKMSNRLLDRLAAERSGDRLDPNEILNVRRTFVNDWREWALEHDFDAATGIEPTVD
jgi:hypothetical protein